jgi:hypothetical protein
MGPDDRMCGECGAKRMRTLPPESAETLRIYRDAMREFWADGVIEDWEGNELARLREELGIRPSTHERMELEIKGATASVVVLPLRLWFDAGPTEDYRVGNRCLVRMKAENLSDRPLKSVRFSLRIGDLAPQELVTRVLGPGRNEVVATAFLASVAGHVDVAGRLVATDMKGKNAHFAFGSIGIVVAGASHGGGTNVLSIDARTARVADFSGLGPRQSEVRSGIASENWIEIGLVSVSGIATDESWNLPPEPHIPAHTVCLVADQAKASVSSVLGEPDAIPRPKACATGADSDTAKMASGRGDDLLAAVATGDAQGVATLLAQGAPVNHRSEDGSTSLHIATAAGHVETVECLLSAGADVHARNEFGLTALLTVFLAQEKDVPSDFNRNVECVRRLVAHGARVTEGNSLRVTSLHVAAILGDANRAEQVLAAGADANGLTTAGISPLFYACCPSPSSDVVEKLLRAGADPKLPSRIQTSDGMIEIPPLNAACMSLTLAFMAEESERSSRLDILVPKVVSVARVLLAAGVALNDRVQGMFSPMDQALLLGRQEMVEFFLRAGARFPSVVQTPDTLISSMELIVSRNMVGVPTLLKELGYTIPATIVLESEGGEPFELSPLELAERLEFFELVEELGQPSGKRALAFDSLSEKNRRAVLLGKLAQVGLCGFNYGQTEIYSGSRIAVTVEGVSLELRDAHFQYTKKEFTWQQIADTKTKHDLVEWETQRRYLFPRVWKTVWEALEDVAGLPGTVCGGAIFAEKPHAVRKVELLNLLHSLEINPYSFYVGEKIPSKKLMNARRTCKVPADEEIVLLYDNTVWGSATNSVLVGLEGVYLFEDDSEAVCGKLDWLEFCESAPPSVVNSFLKIREYQNRIVSTSGGSELERVLNAIRDLVAAANEVGPPETATENTLAAPHRMLGSQVDSCASVGPADGPDLVVTHFQYFVRSEGKQFGPVTPQQMHQAFHRGQLVAHTPVWREGLSDWRAAAQVPELASLFNVVETPGRGDR